MKNRSLKYYVQTSILEDKLKNWLNVKVTKRNINKLLTVLEDFLGIDAENHLENPHDFVSDEWDDSETLKEIAPIEDSYLIEIDLAIEDMTGALELLGNDNSVKNLDILQETMQGLGQLALESALNNREQIEESWAELEQGD